MSARRQVEKRQRLRETEWNSSLLVTSGATARNDTLFSPHLLPNSTYRCYEQPRFHDTDLSPSKSRWCGEKGYQGEGALPNSTLGTLRIRYAQNYNAAS